MEDTSATPRQGQTLPVDSSGPISSMASEPAAARGVVGFAKATNAYFEAQSGLANFLQIGGGTIAIMLFLWRMAKLAGKNRQRFDSMRDWVRHVKGNDADHYSAVDRGAVSLAIVDDQMADHPIAYLKKIGFKPKTYKKFSLARIDELRGFDIVILDVANVIEEDMQRGGLEMIKRLKSQLPAPIVIAVSGKQYDPTVHQYFVLADVVLDKPINELEIEDALTQLLDERLSLTGLATQIDRELQSAFPASSVKATRSIISALKHKRFSEATLVGAPQERKDRMEALILKLKGRIKNA
ncbi:hypothetical protein [Paraburkholderia nemoris]|jgi:CheY-like chemotaxis protein|uniref:hypothetical protein n=1 Tax=Paraburkholderia nemoris TaxID=2793076 RepID=UPI001B8D0F70|nr:hypothetical protein [Paraburkholderia nemoris]